MRKHRLTAQVGASGHAAEMARVCSDSGYFVSGLFRHRNMLVRVRIIDHIARASPPTRTYGSTLRLKNATANHFVVENGIGIDHPLAAVDSHEPRRYHLNRGGAGVSADDCRRFGSGL